MSCEALDPIRMDCRCYVIFSKDQSLFKVMGKAESVKESLLRIRKTCFQVAARQIPAQRKYLLHWPDTPTYPSRVALRRYNHPLVLSSSEPIHAKSSKSPILEGTEVDTMPSPQQLQMGSVTVPLRRTLEKLRYYRGNIQLRIRLGTFLVKQYMEPEDGSYSYAEFENMISMSQFVGEVTNE